VLDTAEEIVPAILAAQNHDDGDTAVIEKL
jgi:hypothetical protein